MNFGAGTTGGCPPGPYYFGPGQVRNLCDVFHFWSLHPSGAHFLFGDNSVRFITYESDRILSMLGTRDGKESVPPFE
jgi:hypothetical protein